MNRFIIILDDNDDDDNNKNGIYTRRVQGRTR